MPWSQFPLVCAHMPSCRTPGTTPVPTTPPQRPPYALHEHQAAPGCRPSLPPTCARVATRGPWTHLIRAQLLHRFPLNGERSVGGSFPCAGREFGEEGEWCPAAASPRGVSELHSQRWRTTTGRRPPLLLPLPGRQRAPGSPLSGRCPPRPPPLQAPALLLLQVPRLLLRPLPRAPRVPQPQTPPQLGDVRAPRLAAAAPAPAPAPAPRGDYSSKQEGGGGHLGAGSRDPARRLRASPARQAPRRGGQWQRGAGSAACAIATAGRGRGAARRREELVWGGMGWDGMGWGRARPRGGAKGLGMGGGGRWGRAGSMEAGRRCWRSVFQGGDPSPLGFGPTPFVAVQRGAHSSPTSVTSKPANRLCTLWHGFGIELTSKQQTLPPRCWWPCFEP